MAHVEKHEMPDEEPDIDGYVVNPATIKEMLGFNSLDEAYEMVQAAVQLGFGVRLSNMMWMNSAEPPELDERWVVEVLADIPLDPDALERDEGESDDDVKRSHP